MPLTKPYLEQMRAHVDEGGQLNHRNAVELLTEVERLNEWADGFSEAQLKERRLCEERIQEIERERNASLQVQRNASAAIDELRAALEKSITLQSHYAKLLNDYDGGRRKQFLDAQDWIERLRTVKAETESKATAP